MKSEPSLARLNDLGMAIENAIVKCEAYFEKQLILSPNSIQTMRKYAQFLLEVRV